MYRALIKSWIEIFQSFGRGRKLEVLNKNEDQGGGKHKFGCVKYNVFVFNIWTDCVLPYYSSTCIQGTMPCKSKPG